MCTCNLTFVTDRSLRIVLAGELSSRHSAVSFGTCPSETTMYISGPSKILAHLTSFWLWIPEPKFCCFFRDLPYRNDSGPSKIIANPTSFLNGEFPNRNSAVSVGTCPSETTLYISGPSQILANLTSFWQGNSRAEIQPFRSGPAQAKRLCIPSIGYHPSS
jgi:hypothetical protein